jgi:hypothetical protein
VGSLLPYLRTLAAAGGEGVDSVHSTVQQGGFDLLNEVLNGVSPQCCICCAPATAGLGKLWLPSHRLTTGGSLRAQCLLVKAEAYFSHGGQGESLAPLIRAEASLSLVRRVIESHSTQYSRV